MSAVKPVPDPGAMFPLTSDSDRIMRLERMVTRLIRQVEGKGGVRRKAPQLIGLYPAKAGGVEVYLRGVGSGVKDRSAYRVGIARDERTAKDTQVNVLQIVVKVLADPAWARELLDYWAAKRGEQPAMQISYTPDRLDPNRPAFGSAIQLAEEQA